MLYKKNKKEKKTRQALVGIRISSWDIVLPVTKPSTSAFRSKLPLLGIHFSG